MHRKRRGEVATTMAGFHFCIDSELKKKGSFSDIYQDLDSSIASATIGQSADERSQGI